MLKYASALRCIKHLIVDRAFVRPMGDGAKAEAALDLIMETISVLDYDIDYLPGRELKGVFNDSRKVTDNSVFVAIAGAAVDGKKFVPQALSAGAEVIISQENISSMLLPGTLNLVVHDAYKAYAMLCEAMYDFPLQQMTAFAVTGTNGKTTSAMLIRQILNSLQQPCGMISTVEYDVGNGDVTAAERTTPEAAELFKNFARMQQHNLSNMVMEVSSHALVQSRIGSIRFNAAIFTNLTCDHLDYHRTMEEYFLAKKRLFTEHLQNSGKAIINCDDPYGRLLQQALAPEQIESFGINNGKWRVENLNMTSDCSSFDITNGSIRQHFNTNLIGLYNVYNIAGAVLALHTINAVTLEKSSEILSQQIFSVPGRLEKFQLRNGAKVFVDYAHTPDALSNVLATLKKLPHQRLTALFGCGGNRDKSKRPLMGKAAADLADKLYITSDNPRNESPEAIISEIVSGIPAKTDAVIEVDRQQAINAALKEALAGDIILIAGKKIIRK